MDFGKTIGLVALVAVGGLALYFFSKRSGSGPGAGGTITIGDETYPIPTEPGVYTFPGGGGNGNGDLVPEYVPPTTYPTQAPTGDELYPLGTQENPLYTEIPGELIPWTGAGGWYEKKEIEKTLGWTEAEYAAQMAALRTEIPAAERTWEQEYAYTGESPADIATAKGRVDFKSRAALYGAEYVGGILVPPDTWAGSVTAFAQYVRESLNR